MTLRGSAFPSDADPPCGDEEVSLASFSRMWRDLERTFMTFGVRLILSEDDSRTIHHPQREVPVVSFNHWGRE